MSPNWEIRKSLNWEFKKYLNREFRKSLNEYISQTNHFILQIPSKFTGTWWRPVSPRSCWGSPPGLTAGLSWSWGGTWSRPPWWLWGGWCTWWWGREPWTSQKIVWWEAIFKIMLEQSPVSHSSQGQKSFSGWAGQSTPASSWRRNRGRGSWSSSWRWARLCWRGSLWRCQPSCTRVWGTCRCGGEESYRWGGQCGYWRAHLPQGAGWQHHEAGVQALPQLLIALHPAYWHPRGPGTVRQVPLAECWQPEPVPDLTTALTTPCCTSPAFTSSWGRTTTRPSLATVMWTITESFSTECWGE